MVHSIFTENTALPLDTLSEQLRLTVDSSLRSHLCEAMAQLKAGILAAQSLGDFYALMEDYSYEKFMQVYNQLTPKQQAELNAICDRDTQMQMAALNTGKVPDFEESRSRTQR